MYNLQTKLQKTTIASLLCSCVSTKCDSSICNELYSTLNGKFQEWYEEYKEDYNELKTPDNDNSYNQITKSIIKTKLFAKENTDYVHLLNFLKEFLEVIIAVIIILAYRCMKKE